MRYVAFAIAQMNIMENNANVKELISDCTHLIVVEVTMKVKFAVVEERVNAEFVTVLRD